MNITRTLVLFIATLLFFVTNNPQVYGTVNKQREAESNFFSKAFNNNLSDGDFVEDKLHNVWYIEGGIRRLIGSYQLLKQLLQSKNKIEAEVLQVVAETLSTKTILGENMYISGNDKSKANKIFSMNQTIPFHPNFSIQFTNPFSYGYDSSLFFNLWMFEPPTNGHKAILHSLPSISETLSVVLFAMPGTLPSKNGIGKKITLFLGVCHSKVSTSTAVGATTTILNLKEFHIQMQWMFNNGRIYQ
jgi:hypothetical protein